MTVVVVRSYRRNSGDTSQDSTIGTERLARKSFSDPAAHVLDGFPIGMTQTDRYSLKLKALELLRQLLHGPFVPGRRGPHRTGQFARGYQTSMGDRRVIRAARS